MCLDKNNSEKASINQDTRKEIHIKIATSRRKKAFGPTATAEAAAKTTAAATSTTAAADACAVTLARESSVVGGVGELIEPPAHRAAHPHWRLHGPAEAHHTAGPERRPVHRVAAVVVPHARPTSHTETTAAAHRVRRGTTESASAAI